MDALSQMKKDPYAFLGVKKIINATCHWTVYGGTLIPDEVLDTMRESAKWHVDIRDLQKAAGRAISKHTHAEDGYIVSGCAAAILVGTAAILTGKDPAKMMQLPDTAGMKDLCVAARFERRKNPTGREYVHYGYAHAVKTAGVKFVEVGDGRRTTAEGLDEALRKNAPNVALTYWTGYWAKDDLPLPDVIAISHRHGVPVLVDASNSLPPRENLHRFVDMGADLVAYSGGKGLQGPQGAGVLAGRKEIIEAVAMQAAPTQGIGRVAKVSKEEVVGMIAALTWWAEQDDEARMTEHHRRSNKLASLIKGLPGAKTEVVFPDQWQRPFPTVHLTTLPASGLDAAQIIDALKNGDPSIGVMGGSDPQTVRMDVRLCEDWELDAIGKRLHEVFAAHKK
ncbi:MAG: aminotransferase class V-fold PLP-dependent enzyme [Dehalococcoidia bacterium]|nr:aminotransferase class V-fold PLP-dependent enzyme [Dehalococcoidia bacterium]MSQ34437.1 aminotransferase class V-fold PLP-dependent enzyme [Dehalococcoidia bacterium]